jgi:Flp pilus assembly protein TadB
LGTVLLLAITAGLATYAGLLLLPRFSPRSQMVARIGPQPLAAAIGDSPLARWLRMIPATRQVRPSRFLLLQARLAGGALLLVLAPWLLFREPPDPAALLLYPVVAWALPPAWLLIQLNRRQALIARGYPDLLAHLVTQTRAGSGTLQAFASAPPVLQEPLRGEVVDLIADLRVAPFPAALERFAARCGLPEIHGFVHNVIHQQSLGISLPEVLADEESHTLALARQAMRKRIQGSAVIMAAVTVILLLNGLAIYFTPVVLDLSRLVSHDQVSRTATLVPGAK